MIRVQTRSLVRRLAMLFCAAVLPYAAHSTLIAPRLAPEVLPEARPYALSSWSRTIELTGTEDNDSNRPHCFQWGTSSSDPPDNGLCALNKAECDAWQQLFTSEFNDTHDCDLYHAAMFCVSLQSKSSQGLNSKPKTLCAMSARRCKYLVDRLRNNQYWKTGGFCVKYTDEQRP